ncbi:MAG: ABC transporter permease [Chloroflexi bacterium]|nr:ABC transporter permease [Chloroflexota bacterium]
MQRYLLGRLVQSIFTILFVLLVVFVIVRLKGDPAAVMLGENRDPETYAAVRRSLHLDDPIHVQFGAFLGKVFRGDLGYSWYQRRPALEVMLERFPATLQLAGAAFFFSLLLAIPLGVVAAIKRDTIYDRGLKIFALLGQAMPTFWVGLLLIVFVAGYLGLLPAGGRGGPSHLILPAIALGWFPAAAIARLTRSAMLDVLDSDFIKMARVKGVPEQMVIWKHAVKNAAIPVVTLMGLQIAGLLSGAVVTEQVFAWPGVGWITIQSIFGRDFPVVQAAVILLAAIHIAANLVVDIVYVYLDPRVRYLRR